MKLTKPCFSLYAEDFGMMKQYLISEEIVEMLSALQDLCIFGETDYEPQNKKQLYIWDKLKAKFDTDLVCYETSVKNGKRGGRPKKRNQENNPQENPNDNPNENLDINPQETCEETHLSLVTCHLTPDTCNTPSSRCSEGVETRAPKTFSKNKTNGKVENLRYGTLQNVLLTEEQYNGLKEKYAQTDVAIEELDTWLGKNSKSAKEARDKNHYAYFKSNSWVWERLNEREGKQTVPLEDEEYEYGGKIYHGELARHYRKIDQADGIYK